MVGEARRHEDVLPRQVVHRRPAESEQEGDALAHDRGGELALGRQVGDVRPETELVEGRLVVAGGQAFSLPATGAR